jgi:hypothetical protein
MQVLRFQYGEVLPVAPAAAPACCLLAITIGPRPQVYTVSVSPFFGGSPPSKAVRPQRRVACRATLSHH